VVDEVSGSFGSTGDAGGLSLLYGKKYDTDHGSGGRRPIFNDVPGTDYFFY